MTSPANTDAEAKAAVIFLARMQPYLAQGMSYQQAGEAVLRRDAELWRLVTIAHHARGEEGETICHELAATVYHEIRGQLAEEKAQEK